MITWSKLKGGGKQEYSVKPYCDCFEDHKPSGHLTVLGSHLGCKCGENIDVKEWRWETPSDMEHSWVNMTDDQRQVTFHPFYSSGTALVKGTSPLLHNHLYYWEVKMLSEPYGTDIMVGVGTDKVDVLSSRYRFTSLLGETVESYGLSYRGFLRHNGLVDWDKKGGFCKGSIIGVKVDLWQGTLEFFHNRQPRGVSFFNLRRHPSMSLFPMLCSTSAQSSLRLIYAGSWQASLLADAAKILAASVSERIATLPPGLRNKMRTLFWLMLPDDSFIKEERKEKIKAAREPSGIMDLSNDFQLADQYTYFYTDSVDVDLSVDIIYDDL